MNKTPTILVLMDGLGISENPAGNAVLAAGTPCLDRFRREFACTALGASGPDAGLPAGQPGGSVVGHVNVGAGRIVRQDLSRISAAIEDGSFFQNPAFLQALDNCLQSDTALHLVGMLSDAGARSHISHLFALLRMAKERGVRRVYIHAILDGQDALPASGADFVRRTVSLCQELGIGKFATLMGRSYATDPNLMEQAYDAMVYGESAVFRSDPEAAVREFYTNGVPDAAIEPVICDRDGTVSDNDSVIFWGFQPGRTVELVRALTDPEFDRFTRQIFPLTCVSATDYGLSGVTVAFPRPVLRNTLGEYLSNVGLTQLRAAESACFEQATSVFNGYAAAPFPGEDRLEIASPKADSLARRPEMNAAELCARCVEAMESGAYDVVIADFANCAAVARTGVFEAAVKAVETVDSCVGTLVDAALRMGGIAMVTSTHGRVEQIEDGHARGTTNPVPFILCGAGTKLRPGRLADIAPTLLDVMGLACPEEMDGRTLIVE